MRKYLKATISALIIYLVMPVAFLFIGYGEMHSSNWGTNDSGAIQDFAFISLAAFSALVCVAIAFPFIAVKIQANFSTRKWVYFNILTVWFMSFMASCLFWYYVGESDTSSIINNALGLLLLLTIIVLVLLAPAMFIWLRIAKISHNKLKLPALTI